MKMLISITLAIKHFHRSWIFILTAGDRDIIMSIDAGWWNEGTEEALQNHQVLTGGAVHIIQSDGVGVTPKTGRGVHYQQDYTIIAVLQQFRLTSHCKSWYTIIIMYLLNTCALREGFGIKQTEQFHNQAIFDTITDHGNQYIASTEGLS